MARSGFALRFPVRNSPALKALARNVRRLRKERDWTQEDLATAAKVEPAAISHIENRRANPTIMVTEAIAKALGVRFLELFSDH
jgi:transcriptional regulator with XRE-family HTH domain